MKRLAIFFFIIVVFIGCGTVNPLSEKTTHTMDQVTAEISKGIDYNGQTITLKAKVKAVKTSTANEDELELETGSQDPDESLIFFYVLANRDKYKPGRTYTFTIYIESVEGYVVTDNADPFYIIKSKII